MLTMPLTSYSRAILSHIKLYPIIDTLDLLFHIITIKKALQYYDKNITFNETFFEYAPTSLTSTLIIVCVCVFAQIPGRFGFFSANHSVWKLCNSFTPKFNNSFSF